MSGPNVLAKSVVASVDVRIAGSLPKLNPLGSQRWQKLDGYDGMTDSMKYAVNEPDIKPKLYNKVIRLPGN